MDNNITKDDLRQFGLLLLEQIRQLLAQGERTENSVTDFEWLKGRVVRKLLDISAGSLQNLRISGKIRYKKVLGSYYYNKSDLLKLFGEN
ncbi:MAG: helix-turn-helix domain-containing protein [Flavobacterium sp.]